MAAAASPASGAPSSPPRAHENGRTLAVIITARDVSGYAETALKAERDQQRLKMALELDDLMVREYDLRTGEIYCSATSPDLEKWCLLQGRSAGDRPSRRPREDGRAGSQS
jgi:hypothetical protein